PRFGRLTDRSSGPADQLLPQAFREAGQANHFHPVATAALGPVESLVGGAVELLVAGLAASVEAGHAEAGGQAEHAV
ncbi:hypothetical protein SC81_22985, partial [Vibrio vulnificus]